MEDPIESFCHFLAIQGYIPPRNEEELLEFEELHNFCNGRYSDTCQQCPKTSLSNRIHKASNADSHFKKCSCRISGQDDRECHCAGGGEKRRAK